MSVNGVYYCTSVRYGEAVLKIFAHDEYQINNEANTLREYKGKSFARLYDVAENGQALLLERIKPGVMLKDVSPLDSRLEIFMALFRNLHKQPENATVYQTYLDWTEDAAKFMQARTDYPQLCEDMIKANRLCHKLFAESTERVLLHGDLHYANILRNSENTYTLIDPKGVIGPAVFDLPRYMLNEYSDEPDVNRRPGIFRHMLERFEGKLGVSQHKLTQLYFIERVMASVWQIQSDIPMDENKVSFARELLAECATHED
jgi:streptomycin 6-kinase